MHKVVIERPRWNPGPGKHGRRANLPDEQLPKFEGIKRPHSCRKGLTDLLGPLRRWLQSQVGRPWNDVYSEACAVIKPDSIIRAHIKTHMLQFVERHTFMHNGKVCVIDTDYRSRGIISIEERRFGWNLFFVHPETGVLEVIPRKSRSYWKSQEPKEPEMLRWLNNSIALQNIHGLWYECHYVRPDGVKVVVYDHALERLLRREELTRHRCRYLLCIRKRQLSRKELREFGLQNQVLTVDEAQSSVGRIAGRLKTALQKLAGRRLWVIGTVGWRFKFALAFGADSSTW